MKKILLFTGILAFSIFTNCKKKHDDPAPANNTSTTSQFGNTSAISSNGTTTDLSTKGYTSGSAFSIIGTSTSGSYQSMTAAFYTGKPTSNYSVDLSKSTDFQLAYVTANTSLRATSGTANVIVSDTTIIVNFTDAVFTDASSLTGGTFKYSGQLILSTKTTGGTTGGTTTTPATTSGSVTVSGGSATALTVQSISGSGMFSLAGYTNSGTSLSAGFYSGKPTASSTQDFSKGANFMLTYGKSSKTYLASAGTADVTVNGTAITVSFTNVTFTDMSSSATVTASGTLYTSK